MIAHKILFIVQLLPNFGVEIPQYEYEICSISFLCIHLAQVFIEPLCQAGLFVSFHLSMAVDVDDHQGRFAPSGFSLFLFIFYCFCGVLEKSNYCYSFIDQLIRGQLGHPVFVNIEPQSSSTVLLSSQEY